MYYTMCVCVCAFMLTSALRPQQHKAREGERAACRVFRASGLSRAVVLAVRPLGGTQTHRQTNPNRSLAQETNMQTNSKCPSEALCALCVCVSVRDL